MKQYVDRWQKRTDRFSLLLSFFFLLLGILFLYLVKIDKEITNYNVYHHELERMRILNYKFDTFFFRAYRYIDYDETGSLEKEFEQRLRKLKERDVVSEFGSNVREKISSISQEYETKKRILEDFKSLNARVTNSIHFLYDLRRTLEKKLLQDVSTKMLIDNIFFSISQILMDMPYDAQRLKKELDMLEACCREEMMLVYFHQHSRQLLKDANGINRLREEVASIPIAESIDAVLEELSRQYNANRSTQKMIAFVLLLFAFVILALLIVSYRRIRKSTRELQAFRYAIEKSDNTIILTNPEREIVYVNEAFEEKSGYAKEEVFGKNPNIMKSNLLDKTFYEEMNRTLDRGEIWQGELINRRKDGRLLYEKASIIPVFIDGELVQYLAVKLDITEYKEQQLRLKQAAAVYRTIGDGILVTDKEKRILSVNPAFVKMFGYTAEELIGKEPMVIRTLKEDTYFYRQMWDQLLTQDRWSGKLHNKTKDGTILPIWLTLTIVRDEHGEIENFIAIYTNLQEIIATQERAEYLAYHDALTGLPNRAYFDLRIVDILDLAERMHEEVALLFMDLDRFKVINDTLGHSVGDGMLIELSKRISGILDKEMLFARMGGDEFVVIATLKEGKEEAARIAEKILTVVREPVHVYDYYLSTTASIGIALFPTDGKEKYEIVKYADSAMYAAKEKGKDNFQFYTRQLSLDVQQRLNMEQELLHSLERKELYLCYQPQYRLSDRRITGVEALVRWNNRNLGMVSPSDFISIAEETGFIVKIGYFIFEEACRAFVRWKAAGYMVDTISINISSVQFREESFLSHIKKTIARTGIDPSAIEIEITERFLMEYTTENMTILEDLRALGCRISIDDFGTGYSSMSYLKQLPLDTIKIDRSFIMDLPDNAHDAVVSRSIIALSKSLGYQVIAEGIENEAQERFLKVNQCDIGQGYYFSKPLPEEVLLDFFEEQGIKTER